MSWTGKPCPFTKQILIKFKIFKMMALHGILVCDSEVHFQTWFVLSSGVFYSCAWSNFSRAAVPWQGVSLSLLVATYLVNNLDSWSQNSGHPIPISGLKA